MEAAFRFGPSVTEGQFQARQRRQRLPLPLLASRLAPWPPSSAHRPATLRMHLPLPSRLRCTVGARPDAQGGRALATPVLCVNQSLPRRFCWGIPAQSTGRSAFHAERRRRTTILCAADKPPEESLKKTVEVDRLIDVLRSSNPRELDQIVVENVLSFDAGFWIRLAARIDLCKSDDDKKDYEELAENVMNIVDRLVHKTDQKIEQSTDVLKAIISPVMHEGDVQWPPRGPDTLKLMEKEIARREQEGQLDEGFLSEVSAQLRQAKQDGDKPGLQAMLQKVLQLYASKSLQKRSYAYKGEQVIVPEKFLECVIQAPENEWNKVLLDGLTVGKGDVSPDDLYAVINKRIERVLIRTEGGSYQQRILVEYLKEIQARAEEVVKVLQGPTI